MDGLRMLKPQIAQDCGLPGRSRHPGANLAVLAAVSVMIVGLMGVSIYLGLQAYVQNEVQKATTTAAMVGASVYYSGNPSGKPAPDPDRAKQEARDTFAKIIEQSKALKGFNAQLVSVDHNDNNDSITLTATATMPTAFLAPVGISSIEVTANGTARALRYEPTQFVGPVSMMPDGTMPSMQRTIQLAFPLVDGPGMDLYVEQAMQGAYAVEACNEVECYDLVAGATPIGSSQIITYQGEQLIVGTAFIDLEQAKVRKANKLRFTHGNRFDTYFAGQGQSLPLHPTPVTISRVFLFGYSGMCPNRDNCPIPAGFAPMQ